MRFFIIVAGLVVVVLAGLFVYGQMLQPETRVIEQEAVRGASS